MTEIDPIYQKMYDGILSRNSEFAGIERRIVGKIQKAWEFGWLPYKSGKVWIVGFHVFVDYNVRYGFPITVGPGRPSKFKMKWHHVNIQGRWHGRG